MQATILEEALSSVAEDEFVKEPVFEHTGPVKLFADKCLHIVRAGLHIVTFTTILQAIWPCIEKAEKHSTGSARSEAAFRSFFQLRINREFKQTGTNFLKDLIPDVDVPVMFLQMFVRVVFERMFLSHEAIPDKDQGENLFNPGLKEKNALRYVAGYIVSRLP